MQTCEEAWWSPRAGEGSNHICLQHLIKLLLNLFSLEKKYSVWLLLYWSHIFHTDEMLYQISPSWLGG